MRPACLGRNAAWDSGDDDRFAGCGKVAGPRTAGELRVQSNHKITLVQADIDGDGVKDFEIELSGQVDIDAGDFLL